MMRASALPRVLPIIGALAGCVAQPPSVTGPSASTQAQTLISTLLPQSLGDRPGWVHDIQGSFTALGLSADESHVCAVIAVVEQESGFQVNPVIPDLGPIASQEIDRRAASLGLPLLLVHASLELRSPDGRTFAARIHAARTEEELSDIYEDFIRQVPLGQRLFEDWNPIRTRGPMQVNVAFARRFANLRAYPYPISTSLEEELFTRRGSLYFGTAHLLAYSAPYDSYLYRFADYNAGQYASRNAAFQSALALIAGSPLPADGSLLPGQGHELGSTEAALLQIKDRLHLGSADIHRALGDGNQQRFEQSAVYREVFMLAERRAGRPLPRARLPDIKLAGPKITRTLTTRWYAQRVYGRFTSCERHML
jgi:hypothetical protein